MTMHEKEKELRESVKNFTTERLAAFKATLATRRTSELIALMLNTDSLSAQFPGHRPTDSLSNPNTQELLCALFALADEIDLRIPIPNAPKCTAQWTAGMLMLTGQPERPSGRCERPAGHPLDYHLFPNGNKQPIDPKEG